MLLWSDRERDMSGHLTVMDARGFYTVLYRERVIERVICWTTKQLTNWRAALSLLVRVFPPYSNKRLKTCEIKLSLLHTTGF